MKNYKLLVLFISIIYTFNAHASDTLAYYAFQSANVTQQHPDVTASAVMSGSGRQALYGFTIASGQLSLKGYGSNLATVWNSKRFVYIILTAATDQYLQLDSLTFDLSVNSSWDLNFLGVSTGAFKDSAAAWTSIAENYAYHNGTLTKGTNRSVTVYFDEKHVNLSTVDIRIYMDGKAGQGYNFDNMTVYGKTGPMVSKSNQSINFVPIADRFLGNGDLKLSATATSGLPVSYSVLSGPATVFAGDSLTFSDTGEVCVTAMQAGNNAFNSAPDSTVCFMVKDLNTSYGINLSENYINVFPNPFVSVFNIQLKGEASWSLADITGTKLMSGKGSAAVNASVLPGGVYVLSVYKSEGIERIKLVKEK